MKQERTHQREPTRNSLPKELDSVVRANTDSRDFNNSIACVVAPIEASSKSVHFNKLQEGDRIQLSRRVRAASTIKRRKSVEWNTTEEEACILPTFRRNQSMPLPVADDKRSTYNIAQRRRCDSMGGGESLCRTKSKSRQIGGETTEAKKSYRERPERRRRSPDKQRRPSSRSGFPEESSGASDAAINFVDEKSKPARRLEPKACSSDLVMEASDAAILFEEEDNPNIIHQPISPQKALQQLLDGSPDAAMYFLEKAVRSERRAESPRRSSKSPRKTSSRRSLRRIPSNGDDQDADPSAPRSKPRGRNSSRSPRKAPRSASDVRTLAASI